MQIGDEVYIHGYVDEIRKDIVIIRNDGGYFGTVKEEIVQPIEDDTLTLKVDEKDLVERIINTAWIPCSERLPEELAEVNITWINTDPEPYYDFIKGKSFTGTAVYYKGRWYWYSAVCKDYLAEYDVSPNDTMDECIKVIAWMPLPKPYRVTERSD